MKKKLLLSLLGLVVVGAFIHSLLVFYVPRKGAAAAPKKLSRVVVNEAVRTLLYIPLYHALAAGYFREEGLEVEIVTGGTASNAFAAMISGEAAFAIADPMYVAIAREKGGKVKVVGQLVGRIAVWGLSRNGMTWDINSVRGKRISTQIRPMTAFVYTNKAIHDLGLDPEKEVTLIQQKPPAEITPLLAGRAEYAFTLEPNTSLAQAQGASIVLSFPEILGDQVFTGILVKEETLRSDTTMVVAFVRACQRALEDLRRNPDSGLPAARRFFSQIDEPTLQAVLTRLTAEHVIPAQVSISAASWNRALTARLEAGDLKQQISIEEGCDMGIMAEALRGKLEQAQ